MSLWFLGLVIKVSAKFGVALLRTTIACRVLGFIAGVLGRPWGMIWGVVGEGKLGVARRGANWWEDYDLIVELLRSGVVIGKVLGSRGRC